MQAFLFLVFFFSVVRAKIRIIVPGVPDAAPCFIWCRKLSSLSGWVGPRNLLLERVHFFQEQVNTSVKTSMVRL